MANSFQTHTGNGVTATFSWSQIDGFLSSAHIFVSVNGLAKTAGTHYTLNTTARTVTFTAGNIPESLAFIQIRRITPKTEAGLQTVFTDGSVTTAADLNAAQRQQLYIAQEAQDTGSGAMPLDENGEAWDAQARRIGSLAAPLALEDAATKGYVDSIALFGASTIPQSWTFSGTGAKLNYDLTSPSPTATDAQMFLVEVNGVLQRPSVNYNIVAVGSVYQLQFDAAPSAGTGNIVVRNFGVARNALDVLPNASVTNQYLALLAVATANLQDLAVTAQKIAASAIETAKIADDAIIAAKIAANAVTSQKIAAAAVGTSKIADAAVTTDKLADLAITAAKLANQVVTASKLADASVNLSKINTAAFTGAGAENRLLLTDAAGALSLQAIANLSLSLLGQPTADIPMNNRTFSGLQTAAFTPRFLWGGNAASVTYSVQTGRYIKVGRLVFFTGALTLSAMGGSTGNATIADLPFPCEGSGWSIIGAIPNSGFTGLTGAPVAYLDPATNQIVLGLMGATGNSTLTKANFTNTSQMLFSGCYIATS